MSNVNIFRYCPQHMKADLFRTIAKDLRLDGEFAQGDEGMVLHNKRQILTWSQPNAKFGGVLFYVDRDRSLGGLVREIETIFARLRPVVHPNHQMGISKAGMDDTEVRV